MEEFSIKFEYYFNLNIKHYDDKHSIRTYGY